MLGMKRVAALIVPKFLNFKQKQRRTDFAQELLMVFNYNPDLNFESWADGYDIKIKAQSSKWKRSKEPSSVRN